MSLSTKVVFPAPPPTTNELTPQQRAQLIRQAKKIEQLLGSTPYLVDTSVAIHVLRLSRRPVKSPYAAIDHEVSQPSDRTRTATAHANIFCGVGWFRRIDI